MSESATEQKAPETKAPEPQQSTEQGNPDEAALGDPGKKALDAMKANWKAAEKQANQFKSELDALKQANESALEKAQREASEAQAQALQAGTDALRYRIAAESGITENVDLILTAPDEETMRKQAELWAAHATQTPASSAGPRPDLSQGSKGAAASSDPAVEFGRIIQRQLGT